MQLMHKSEGRIFLDVGANQGLFSCAVGCGADCDVVAIEAAPDVFTQLQRNVRANPALHAKLVHSCAAPRGGLIQFFVPQRGREAWGGVRPKEGIGSEHLISFWSGATALEDILTDVGVRGVHVLKIDVEGYELEVFAGLDWLGRFRPRHIIVECDPNERQKIDFLEKQGYFAQLIDGRPALDQRVFPEGNLWFTDSRIE